ncbi:MAG: response regulator transcription factor [Cyclobacteriaceae bacterium]|nr:response regulator transcription factor [Cyclobacteriaceae bacterium]
MHINIGIVDDHVLFGKSLATLLHTFEGFQVVVDARNGAELLDKCSKLKQLPDIMLIDVEMPVMNGQETAQALKNNYPAIRLVALSVNKSDNSVISMMRAGCCSYLLKDSPPRVLEQALREVYVNSYYNSEIHNNSLGKLLVTYKDAPPFTEAEMEFLRLACSEITYKQIAEAMNVSARTVDGYRSNLFEKLNVQTRTGMILEAMRRGLLKL